MKKRLTIAGVAAVATVAPIVMTVSCAVSQTSEQIARTQHANIIQKQNSTLIKGIVGGSVINQGVQAASDLAFSIKNAGDLKRKLGIILPKLIEAKVTSIHAVGNAKGEITVTLTTYTAYATVPINTITIIEKIKGKTDAEINAKYEQTVKKMEQINVTQKQNNKLIENLTGGSLLYQGMLRVGDIANTITNEKDLKNNFNIDLPKLIGSKVTSISAGANPNGTITIQVTTNTPGASIPNKTVYITKKIRGKTDAEIAKMIVHAQKVAYANTMQKINNKLVQDLTGGWILSQNMRIVDEIAFTITNVEVLQNQLNITLPKLIHVTNVHASGAANGEITVEITTYTEDASVPSNTITIIEKIKGKSNIEVIKEIQAYEQAIITMRQANAVQKRNNKLIQDLAVGSVYNQGNRRVGDIANTITNEKDLKNNFNIDLPKLIGSKVTSISADGNPNGTITIQVTTNTPGAAIPDKTVYITKKVRGKNDDAIAKIIAIADDIQRRNNEWMKGAEMRLRIYAEIGIQPIRQGSMFLVDYVKTIRNGDDLIFRTNIGVESLLAGYEIIGVDGYGYDNSKDAWLHIHSYTQYATIPYKTITLHLKWEVSRDENETIEYRKHHKLETYEWTKIPTANYRFGSQNGNTRVSQHQFESLLQIRSDADFSHVAWIKKYAFQRLKTLPVGISFGNVQWIEEGAFLDLTSLPDSINFATVTSIEKNAFKSLTSLPTNFNINPNVMFDKIKDGFPSLNAVDLAKLKGMTVH